MTDFLFIILVYFFSIVIHEVAHGFVAYALGDPTAKNAGRLTLNPLAHIDPFGTILLPLIMAIPAFVGGPKIIFGWAKPVPFNPAYFKRIRLGTFLVAIAGVAANFLVAALFAVLIRVVVPLMVNAVAPITIENLVSIFSLIVFANLVLGIFNLFPIPPLDGSKILFSVLPPQFREFQFFLERYGIFILLFLIFFAPGILRVLVENALRLFLG